MERKGQEITLFVLWPGFMRMTPDETIALAHALLGLAFETQREAAMTVSFRPDDGR